MAEFVTKKENTRRLAIVIICALVDAVALAVGIYAVKKAGDLDKAQGENIPTLQAAVNKQREDNDRLAQQLRQYARHVGWSTYAVGTTDRFETTAVDEVQLKKYLSDWVGELKKLGVTKYKRWDEQAGGENLTLTALLTELEAKEKEYRESITKLEGEIATERKRDSDIAEESKKQSETLKTTLDGNVAANQPAAGLIGEYLKLVRQLNADQKNHAEELASLEEESVRKQSELTALKNENVRKRAGFEATREELRKRIYAIQHTRAEAAVRREADGEILAVNEERKICYINLLHKDRLFKGTRFTVYALERGGEKIDKGEIEVIEVRREVSSVCAILRTQSADSPLRPGDKFYNELYEGARPKYVAFAGRFSGKLSNEEAATIVREFGDLYQDKVDEKTNYLVVGPGYEEHPNFKLAQDLGVKILREKVLYDYLGVK